MHYAVGGHKYEIVKQLLLAGATVDGPDIGGNAPLMVAAMSCDKEMCNLLLKHGANVYAGNKYRSDTAMDYAVRYNNVDAVTAFLQHAAENPSKAAIKMIPSGLRGPAFGGYPSILNLFSDHCGKFSIMIPLKLLLDDAIHKHNLHQGVNGHEECVILVLHQGCFPKSRETNIFKPFGSCFQKAGHCGLINVMGHLAELNPWFLQEDWLIQGDFSAELEQHSSFLSWLMEYRKQPPDLRKLCKSVIISQLGTHYMLQVDNLPLPKALRTFLQVVETAYINPLILS